jgi:glycosyltransferase involved in cell wall biosynthesis
MKVQYLSASGELGGAEVCLLDMMASLQREQPGWRLGLIAAQRGPLIERARSMGVTTTVLPFPPALSRLGDSKPLTGHTAHAVLGAKLAAGTYVAAAYSRELRRCIKAFAPDVLHSNSLKMNLLGAWAKGRRLPFIWHLHDYVSSRPFMSKALRFCRSRCSAILANSNSVRDDARSSLVGSEIHTLYNAIDINEFSPEGPVADLDALCNLQPSSEPIIRVGLLATMAWWKGHKDFIQALALLGRRSSIRGYVIGGPLYHTEGSQMEIEELRRLSRQLDADRYIGFTGFLERPSCAIRALDIVVHASTRPEPFGRVIVEAMSCAKPVITTAVGGAGELISAGNNALDFRMGDCTHLAERIRELADDSQLRSRLGTAGRKTVMDNFDRRRLGNQLASFYQQVLESAA